MDPAYDGLSLEEKIRFIQALWDELGSAPESLPLSDAQAAELDRRLERSRTHPEESTPWEVVRARIFGGRDP